MLAAALSRRSPECPTRCGFTLIEVLVVIAIIAVLIGALLPALGHGRQLATQAVCLSNLRQISVAMSSYALENDGSLPYGPKAPPPSATNFYPHTGNVTSLISLENGSPVGLGLLLGSHLANTKELLFCPGADDKWDTKATLAAVGVSQVEASYYYRHASVTSLSGPLPVPRMNIDRLGKNRHGDPIRCLAMDSQFLAPPKMALFNLRSRTHHRKRAVDALFTDGHASKHKNVGDRFTVNVSISVYRTLDRILEGFEILDKE